MINLFISFYHFKTETECLDTELLSVKKRCIVICLLQFEGIVVEDFCKWNKMVRRVESLRSKSNKKTISVTQN